MRDLFSISVFLFYLQEEPPWHQKCRKSPSRRRSLYSRVRLILPRLEILKLYNFVRTYVIVIETKSKPSFTEISNIRPQPELVCVPESAFVLLSQSKSCLRLDVFRAHMWKVLEPFTWTSACVKVCEQSCSAGSCLLGWRQTLREREQLLHSAGQHQLTPGGQRENSID